MKWEAWRSLASDETHWQNVEEKGLLKAEPLGDYRLHLWFEEALDVAMDELDVYPLLVEEDPSPALLPLRHK
jgi:hypothetical protein